MKSKLTVEDIQKSKSLMDSCTWYWFRLSRLYDILNSENKQELKSYLTPQDKIDDTKSLEEIKDQLKTEYKNNIHAIGYKNLEVWKFIKNDKHPQWMKIFDKYPEFLKW